MILFWYHRDTITDGPYRCYVAASNYDIFGTTGYDNQQEYWGTYDSAGYINGGNVPTIFESMRKLP